MVVIVKEWICIGELLQLTSVWLKNNGSKNSFKIFFEWKIS